MPARAEASVGRGKGRAGAGRKLIQVWYRMAVEVNRELSCVGPLKEAACIQIEIHQERCMKLLLHAFYSVLNHITKHLLP